MLGHCTAGLFSRIAGTFLLCTLFLPLTAHMAEPTETLSPEIVGSFSPRLGSFMEGALIEVPILIDTKGNNISAVNLHVSFDPNKLQVITPAVGNSILSAWSEAPVYSNSSGTLHFAGEISEGIRTSGGLIATVVFKALEPGLARLSVQEQSRATSNDGRDTQVRVASIDATYTILQKQSGAIRVYTENATFATFAGNGWYNSRTTVLHWDDVPGASGYSYLFDSVPSTAPPNTVQATGTVAVFEPNADGVYYFHLKARTNALWGATTHFAVKIDTTPPRPFVPTVQYISDASVTRALISFKATDALSNIDHYEIGVIDKDDASDSSPIFTETTSPFQLRINSDTRARVIVRAVDRGGNVRDAFVDISKPVFLFAWMKENVVTLLVGTLLSILALFTAHIFIGHHMVRRFRLLFGKKITDTATAQTLR